MPAGDGLNSDQMAAAISEFGLSPAAFSPVGPSGPDAFGAILKTYLASGVPVVLHLAGEDDGHAVTAVGFSEGDDFWELDFLGRLRVRSLRRVYLHDDRLGPYARHSIKSTDGDLLLQLVPSEDGDEWATHLVEPLRVYSGIAPVYPKLRMTPLGLLAVGKWWRDIARRFLGSPPPALDRFSVRTRFELSGNIVQQVLKSKLSVARASTFAQTVLLSRYVGVVELYFDDQPLLWALCDATDVNRDRNSARNTIAVLPFVDALITPLEKIVGALPELSETLIL